MLRGLFVLFLFASSQLSAQMNEHGGAKIAVAYNPLDFFARVYCVPSSSKQLALHPYLGLGINRTFFQQRLFPELGGQLSYSINKTGPVRFIPYAQVSFMRLKVTSDNAHYWENNEVGLRIELHKKHDYGVQFGYINMIEFWSKRNSAAYYGITGGMYFKL